MLNSKLNSTMFDHVNRIERCSVLKFRLAIDGQGPSDVHRVFTGAYYPRWRSFYIDEVREILKEFRTFPTHPFYPYEKEGSSGEDDASFFPDDFQVGNKVWLALPTYNQRDDRPRRFVVTSVDRSKLDAGAPSSASMRAYARGTLHVPEDVIEDLLTVRDAFIAQAGGAAELGIKNVGRRFRVIDDDGNRSVAKDEFQKSLADVGLKLPPQRVDKIFSAFDLNADGHLQFEELVAVMRGPMNETRMSAVREMFKRLDLDGDGHIAMSEIRAKFNAANHPMVMDGTFTAESLLSGFLTTWDANKQKRGLVSFAEFTDYYSGVSAFVDDDAMFVAILENSWKTFR